MRKSTALKIRSYIETAVQSLDNESALEVITLYPEWCVGIVYTTGLRVKYNDELYSVLQDHISQETWNPVDAPSLWAKVLIPDENVIPAWEQPDSTNGYAKGNKVVHNDKTWESLIDNNVWEPGAVGTETLWVEVTE